MMKKARFHNLTIKDIRRETPSAVSIALSVPEELSEAYTFEPGQHLNFKTIIDGEEIRRSYSICTAVYEGELRVAVKIQPYGKFSTFANKVLKVGDEIEVMTPSGLFTNQIVTNKQESYLFFAGGSGITPIMSHIKTILHTTESSNVTLVYGNRGFNDIIFREELEALKNKHMDRMNLVHVFSEEKIGNKIQEGLLNQEKVKEINDAFFKEENFDKVFVCGPQPMILAVKEVYEGIGVDPSAIHFELFSSPDDHKKKEGVSTEKKIEANVKIILDGEETLLNIDSDGLNILDSALNIGIDAPYSCKGGVCSTCKGKVLEGEVKMDRNYALEEDELEAGYVLTCQAHPISEKLIISYDE